MGKIKPLGKHRQQNRRTRSKAKGLGCRDRVVFETVNAVDGDGLLLEAHLPGVLQHAWRRNIVYGIRAEFYRHDDRRVLGQ